MKIKLTKLDMLTHIYSAISRYKQNKIKNNKNNNKYGFIKIKVKFMFRFKCTYLISIIYSIEYGGVQNRI